MGLVLSKSVIHW